MFISTRGSHSAGPYVRKKRGRVNSTPRENRLRFEPLESRALLASNQYAVIGDYGTGSVNEQKVSDLVHTLNPAAIITAGDNNYPDGAATTIDPKIGKYYHDYIGNYQGTFGPGSPTNRFWPTLGNHDYNNVGNDAQPYLDYFTLPGNERYYDVVLGNIHFWLVNSEPEELDGNKATSVQAQWLQAGLAASTSPFDVVVFHRAPYSSAHHGGTANMQQWPFKTWGAEAVISGHDHDYERLLVNGLSFFVNGAGGAGLYAFEMTDPPPAGTSQVRYNALHGAMLLTDNGTSLTFQFININGQVIDTYTIGTTQTALSIQDVAVLEGNAGTANAMFTVSLSSASAQSVTVNYATANGTAAGNDYTATSGILTFAPGVTSRTITVTVTGDTMLEPHEMFSVNLSNAVNAAIARASATGTITNDDGALTQTFQDGINGYSGTKDTAIDVRTPTTNVGGNTQILVDGNPDVAVLLKWDVSSIPVGATVQSASLTLNLLDGTIPAYELYGVKRKWTEDLATWTTARSGSNWEIAGAKGASDRSSTVIATIENVSSGLKTFPFNAAGVALIQSWVANPAASLGVIIQDYVPGDGFTFESSEAGTKTNRPKLTITYSLPAAAQSVRFAPAAVDNNMLAMELAAAELQITPATSGFVRPIQSSGKSVSGDVVANPLKASSRMVAAQDPAPAMGTALSQALPRRLAASWRSLHRSDVTINDGAGTDRTV